jgi:CheY-like chemotaxis protein
VRLLEKRGYNVSQAATGDAAVALSQTKRPDIVRCDTTLAGVSGVEMVHRLAGPGTGGPPRFLFIAGEHAPHMDERALAGLPVLSKPFTASELEEALAQAGISTPLV